MADRNRKRNNPPSVVEWLSGLKIPGIKKIRTEDYSKRDRLKILSRVINLPYLTAQNITPNEKKEIKKQLLAIKRKNRNNDLYLFKLLPLNNNSGKIRIQQTLPQCLSWLNKAKINTKKFRYELIKQPTKITHSTVFCIDDKGIWGELIKDHIIYFSQGNYQGENLVFYYDYKKWHFSGHDQKAIKLIKRAVHKLLIKKNKLPLLKKELNATFAKSGYLKGYFEFIVDHNKNINFVDYNRILNKLLRKTIITITRHTDYLHGTCIGPGKIRGEIRKIKHGYKKMTFQKNEILVSPLITFQHLPYIKKAGGIITEQGTVLSHAAIVSRELKKPYVANVKDAMKKLKDGDWVTVDADQGKIIIH